MKSQNIEQGMTNIEVDHFIIRNSVFDIRYSTFVF